MNYLRLVIERNRGHLDLSIRNLSGRDRIPDSLGIWTVLVG